MKRRILPLVAVAVVVAGLLFLFEAEREVPPRTGDQAPQPVEVAVDEETASALAEVRRVHALLVNFHTAVKEPYRPPLGDNRDVVRALTGGNRYGDVLLATNDPALNTRGEWVDRWGVPYHFHARAAGVIDVRSAGPDRILFTDDDVFHP